MGQFCSNTFTTLLLVIIICASSLIQGSEGNKRPTQKNPCTKPIGVVNHAAIHPDYQNEETFKHRDRIRYECLPGFLKEGDLSQECQDGKWTSVQGKCKPGRTCSKPADVANANLRSKYRDIETFTESSEVEYDCNIGYSITGRSRNRKCLKSGNWSPVEFDCELIRCTYLPHPENGRRTDANNGAGETTRFSCNPGYTLKGPSQLVCRTDGEWSPRYTPKCEPILCPELSSLRNGDIFQDTSDGVRNNYGSIAQYTCNYGFTINGTRSRQINRRCEADGTWDGHNYFCDTEKCEPIEFYGGNLQYFGSIHRAEGTYAYYSCHDGYTMSPPGVDYSECKRTSLRWEPEPPKCYGNCRIEEYQPIDSFLVRRQRARTDKDAIIHGEKIIYSCKNQWSNELCVRPNDHDLCTYYEENFETTCINGTFDKINRNTLITCPERRCSITYQTNTCVWPNGENCIKENYKIQSQSSVNVKCNDGNRYELYENLHKIYPEVDSSTIKCDRGNLLTDLSCVPKRCDMSDIPTNMFTSRTPDKSHIMHNDQINYKCINDQYELYVKSTDSFPRSFISTCRFGDFDVLKQNFPMCIERRCDITYQRSVFENACFWTDDDHRGHCKPENFKIASGSSVNIGCRDGYELYDPIGRRYIDVERSEMSCIKGQYSKNLSCKQKRCALSNLPMNNFTIRTPVGTHIEHGQSISYTCKKPDDYELYVDNSDTYATSFSARCNLGHITTSLQEFPLCLEKHCEFRPKDGVCYKREKQCHSRRFDLKSQESIKIKCTDGYKLVRESGDEAGETATIKCNKGKPEEDFYCVPESKWKKIEERVSELGGKLVAKASNLFCRFSTVQLIACSDSCLPEKIENGFVIDIDALQEVKHGLQVSTRCYEGYDRVGRSDNTCENGEWKYSFPQCIPKPCIKTFQEGEIVWYGSTKISRPTGSTKTYSHGTNLDIECASGYTMKTQSQNSKVMTTECVLGVWKPLPSCVPNGCILSILAGSRYFIFENNTNNKVLERDLIPHGTHVYTECITGYDMVKQEDGSLADVLKTEVICSLGSWKNFHQCKKRCAAINSSKVISYSHVHDVTQDFRHGDTAKIRCIKGDNEVKCDDGRWKGYDEILCLNHNCGNFADSSDSTIDSAYTGLHPVDLALRVIGGSPTDKGLKPWQVGVRVPNVTTGGDMHWCGGTILSEYWILSAAHCFMNLTKDNVSVRVGDHNNTRQDDFEQEFKLEHLITHSQYNESTFDYDIALLKIKPENGTGIKFGVHVQPACLPDQNSSYVNGKQCHVSGWGRTTKDRNKSLPDILQSATVNIINDETCQRLYNGTKRRFTPRMVCAGYLEGGIDTCGGDSGGPLVCDINGLYTLMGVTSWGRGCGLPNAPGVYARVTEFIPWIQANVKAYSEFPNGVEHECEITNGHVRKMYLNEVQVSCDDGYLLNHIEKTKTCECTATGIDCKSVPNPPKCVPENCKIPEKNEHDSGLTIYVPIDGSDVGLSSGMEVKHGDSINFKCSYSETEHLELDYTRLECMKGKWLKVATNEERLKLNSSDFPKCRTAICIPLCENGGKCVRDDTCECPPQSTGKRCEKVECDLECDKNGGKCIAPGKCGQCPHGKSGTNCQDRGCFPPDGTPPMKTHKVFYQTGEVIDTDNFRCPPGYFATPKDGMRCESGNWSTSVKCIRGCTLPPGLPQLRQQEKLVYFIGERITSSEFVCNIPSVLSSTNPMTCMEGGLWNETIKCGCSPPVHASPLRTQKQFYNTGEIIASSEFVCNSSSIAMPEKGMTCMEDGHWTEPVNCIKDQTGCNLPSGDTFFYISTDGDSINPGSFIRNGRKVQVSCQYIEPDYDHYDYSVDMAEKETDTVQCLNGQLGNISLKCTTVPETCTALANGLVIRRFMNEYEVSCDEGYALNLILPDMPYCTCRDDKLVCQFGGQTPECKPVPCKIPETFDSGLTIHVQREEGDIFLSGGVQVDVGENVILSCTHTDVQYFEPNNRRFKCENGKWLEAETDQTWDFGNKGEFPKCRNTTCEPFCKNGGECIRDDTCKCPHHTSGKRCENDLLDDCFKYIPRFFPFANGRERLDSFFIGIGTSMNDTTCRLECLNWTNKICKSVFHNTVRNEQGILQYYTCWGFKEHKQYRQFYINYDMAYGRYYVRTCL